MGRWRIGIAAWLLAVAIGLGAVPMRGAIERVGAAPVLSRTNAQPAPPVVVRVPGGSYHELRPSALHALLPHKHFLLVNVHIPYAGEIAKTDRFIPYTAIDRSLRMLPSSKTAMIVLYCRSGRMSAIAAARLVRLGFRNVWDLAGGMEAWRREGYPLRFRLH
jgi:rhodanese-related sulfurtransferase